MTKLVLSLTVLATALVSSGCATEQKMLKTSHYTLSYPDYWKVQSVGEKDGEPTHVVIGKYSETAMTAPGEGPNASQQTYETSMADVDVRIYAWPAPAQSGDSTQQAAMLMLKDPDLQMDKQGRLPEQRDECGREFKRKYTLFGSEHDTLDLASRPGHRMIVLGAQDQGTLIGVASRVPYEQDVGLYCYNLSNMRVQLQLLLDGLKPVASAPAPSGGPPAPTGGAPAQTPPPAGGGGQTP